MVFVEDFNIGRRVDLTRRHRAWALSAQRHTLWALGMHAQRQLLDIQDDVDDIFAHALKRGEFMHDTVNLHRCHGRALQRRQ